MVKNFCGWGVVGEGLRLGVKTDRVFPRSIPRNTLILSKVVGLASSMKCKIKNDSRNADLEWAESFYFRTYFRRYRNTCSKLILFFSYFLFLCFIIISNVL